MQKEISGKIIKKMKNYSENSVLLRKWKNSNQKIVYYEENGKIIFRKWKNNIQKMTK